MSTEEDLFEPWPDPWTDSTTSTKEDLFEACSLGKLGSLRQAIDNGVDPNAVTKDDYLKETPLHTACR